VIGRYGGLPFVERHGRLLHLGPSGSSAPSAGSTATTTLAVLWGRVIPVIRSFISIPAGVFGMPIGRYTLLTIPGSAVWAFGIAGIGYALGTHYERFHRAFDIALVAGAVLLVLYLVLRRRSSRLTPRA
jgi:membrane protein DedA with SNARE-associated domain